jgi:membrane fusion protein, multidrug efflux system
VAQDPGPPERSSGAHDTDHPTPHSAEQERGIDRDRESSGRHGRPRLVRRPIVWIVLITGVVLAVVAGILWWLHARRFESTDDAYVDARTVRLAPQISGRVARVHVTDNQLVRAGEVLVEIDRGDVGAQLAQAESQRTLGGAELTQAQTQVQSSEASYAQAQALVASAAAQAENAKRDLDRYTSLQATNPRAVAPSQLDQASATARSTAAQRMAAQQQANSANAAVAAARAQEAAAAARIKVLDAQVQQARLNFGYAQVLAPVDGHVAQRTVAVGTFVSPGQQMMAIVPLEMWVTANFKETQLAQVRPGQHVRIEIDACPAADAHGHVDSIQRGAGQAFALLPPQNATGNFVKVVQRVPVKIVFDRVSADCPLGPGLSVIPRVEVQ